MFNNTNCYPKSEISQNVDLLIQKYKNKKVVLYGAGKFCDWLLSNTDISDLNIIGIVDKKFSANADNIYHSYPCYSNSEIFKLDFDAIIVTLLNINSIPKFYKDMITQKGIVIEELFDRSLFWSIWVGENYKINLEKSNDAYQVIPEIFYYKCYNIEEYVKDLNPFVVYDLGANRGYSALYFANNPLCYKVYGFEPCEIPLNIAKRNIRLNPHLEKKITLFDFGLSDKNETAKILMYPEFDYCSTTSKDFLLTRSEERNSEIEEIDIELKKSSEVLENLFKNDDINLDKILKIDVEGSEYSIIPDLYDKGILRQFRVIIGELHIVKDVKETRKLYKYMFDAGFLPIHIRERFDTTIFLFVKND